MILMLKHPGYLLKWVGISSLIGLVAGCGAIGFYLAIRLASSLFLGNMIGYLPPVPAGEGTPHAMPFWGTARLWLLPLVTSLGGLLSGLLVFKLAPEAQRGGQDPPITAFHNQQPIRARVALIKLLASAIIIGTGGSAGREGPIAHIGASLGSTIGRIFRLKHKEQSLALIAGMAAGISSIFRSPLGGSILAIEIVYQEGLASEALLPALLASSIGYALYSSVFGWQPLFAIPTHPGFPTLWQLLAAIPLGLFCGLLGRLYATSFQYMGAFFRGLPLPDWIKPALGGLIVGLLGLLLPQILGTGYGWVQISMGANLAGLPLWIILLFPFVKILSTSLSIESGGSGGIFGPGMVIGGMGGALFWRLASPILPGVPPEVCIIIGMMALLGGIGHVPIASIVMVAEMTGNLSLLLPGIIAVTLSCLVVGKQTLYKSQRDSYKEHEAYLLPASLLPNALEPHPDYERVPMSQ